jgi:hypothetical protein
MPLLNAAPMVGMVRQYRGAWIGGGYGKGKTSFAIRLSYEFLKRGYRLVTNTRCVWADDLNSLELLCESGAQLKAVVLLDEGGMYFNTGKDWEEMAQYVRKMDCIYLVPSHSAPASVAQEMTIEPLFSFIPCGIPFIVYKWSVRTRNVRDAGFFGWWQPSEVYGLYSTLDPGDSPEDIVDFMYDRTWEFKAYYERGERRKYRSKYRYQVRGVDSKRREDETVAGLMEAADQFAQAADTLETVSKRKRRRWRRFV